MAAIDEWTEGRRLHAKRPRILVEADDGAIGWALDRLLVRWGYDPVVCNGPGEVSCPLLRRGRCQLVDQADAVVCLLAGDAGPPLVRIHRSTHPAKPLISGPDVAARAEIELPQSRRLGPPLTRQRVLQAIADAVGPGTHSRRLVQSVQQLSGEEDHGHAEE